MGHIDNYLKAPADLHSPVVKYCVFSCCFRIRLPTAAAAKLPLLAVCLRRLDDSALFIDVAAASKIVSSEFFRTIIAGGCVFARDNAGLGLDFRLRRLLDPSDDMTTWFDVSRFINVDVDILPRPIKTFSSWSFLADAVVRIFLAAPPLLTLSKAVWLRAVLMRGDRLCFWNLIWKFWLTIQWYSRHSVTGPSTTGNIQLPDF